MEPERSKLARVEEAVQARAHQLWASRGEEGGQDGVGGDYYEYLDHTADVQVREGGKAEG